MFVFVRLQERACGLARGVGLLHGQGGRDPSCPLPGARGASAQIRVNVVNPTRSAGSKIWTGEWKSSAQLPYKMDVDELEAHYRERSMLKLSVFPEDIAEAIYFLASDMSAKSTGNIVNVDAGNAQSFTR